MLSTNREGGALPKHYSPPKNKKGVAPSRQKQLRNPDVLTLPPCSSTRLAICLSAHLLNRSTAQPPVFFFRRGLGALIVCSEGKVGLASARNPHLGVKEFQVISMEDALNLPSVELPEFVQDTV